MRASLGPGGMQATDGWTIAFWCWWRLVQGEHRVVAVLGVSGLLLGGWSTTLVLNNPSNMTGEGQPCCLDPTGSCPGKGDTDPTAKHLALPCPGNTTTRAGLGPAPDCKAWSCGSHLCQQDFHATALDTKHSAHLRGQEESGGLHSTSAALEDKEPQREGPGRAERFGVGRGEVWPVCRFSALGQTPARPRSRRVFNPHHLKP